MRGRVLVIDDEEGIRYTFGRFLGRDGYEVDTAEDFDAALELVRTHSYDLIVADIVLRGKTGIDLLRQARAMGVTCPVIIITGVPDLSTAQEAVRLGAYDYIAKPLTREVLLRVVGKAVEYKKLLDEKERYRLNLEAVFRSVREIIVTTDDDMRLLSFNDAARLLCGFAEEFLGGPLQSAGGVCTGGCMQAIQETLRTKLPVEVYRSECRAPEGRGLVLNITASPLLGPMGEAAGAVLVGRDVSRVVRLERNQRKRDRLFDMIGRSERMLRVYSLIEDLADIKTTVLITGESGTGKELVVDALHALGSKPGRPLVKVNCAALTETLLESELFGHVKGAFSGAIGNKVGRFQLADGGTIFLDEIGDISRLMQSRLLRVLQQKEFERVGDSTTMKVDVRVVAATNTDLRAKVKKGEFREDLFYRLNVVEIALPPLRDRREDVPLLVDHFVGLYNEQFGMAVEGVSGDVMDMLVAFHWPGNVRQLAHVLEHAFIHAKGHAKDHPKGGTIMVEDLPDDVRSGVQLEAASQDDAGGGRARILSALERTAGNKAKAARMLGISRQTLYRKLKDLGLDVEGQDYGM